MGTDKAIGEKAGSGDGEARRALIAALRRSWQTELEGAATYRWLAGQVRDRRRKELLEELAQAEERHASQCAERLGALGAALPDAPRTPIPLSIRLRARAGLDTALRAIEMGEERHLQEYEAEAATIGDPESAALMREMAQEEGEHAWTLRAIAGATEGHEPRGRLEAILKHERHVSTGSWIGDAIYGANDGLGAIFGLVAGVAGASASSEFILVAGVAGAVAAAVSMGSGAYLAAKSEREVHDAELSRERREFEEHPEEEREELSLFYQLKGFPKQEADALAERLAKRPDEFMRAIGQEELGLAEERLPNPWISALSATLSTGAGAGLPVVPFLFLHGQTAVLAAFVVSLVGHFVVGAAKSLVTIRPWWISGLEMTIIGVIVGVVTYAVGSLFGVA
ncbi:MAG: VIT1/CCC1 transporter family protein [Chloroflexi bacterium]|nr:VIT1/CCC1 transporter family protein [Chloroflexota bacterium]